MSKNTDKDLSYKKATLLFYSHDYINILYEEGGNPKGWTSNNMAIECKMVVKHNGTNIISIILYQVCDWCIDQ